MWNLWLYDHYMYVQHDISVCPGFLCISLAPAPCLASAGARFFAWINGGEVLQTPAKDAGHRRWSGIPDATQKRGKLRPKGHAKTAKAKGLRSKNQGWPYFYVWSCLVFDFVDLCEHICRACSVCLYLMYCMCNVCMHVCMCACMQVCMLELLHVCMFEGMHVFMFEYMHVLL